MPAPAIPRHHLEAYSAGRLTRRELEGLVAESVSFGTVLLQLREARLPLPRIPSDPATVRIIVELISHSRISADA